MDVPAEILLLHLLWDFSNKLKEKKKVFNVHISPLKKINNPSIWSNTLTLFMILIACKIKNCTNLISGAYGCLMLGSCWGGTEFCRLTCITPCDTAKDHCQFSAGWCVCKQVGMYLILYTPWTCLQQWFKNYKCHWALFFQGNVKDTMSLSSAKLILAEKHTFPPFLGFVFG